MGFRFIHAADIHLDSPLRGLAAMGDATAERIRTATRAAFEGLISAAIEEEVSFIVIAGDLYDGEWRDFRTGLFFAGQMGRLASAGIKVFLLYGNHDAESQITKKLVLPSNAKAFTTRKPETFLVEDLQVAIHGQSFKQRDISENLVPNYPDPVPGMFNIGVLHTGLGSAGVHANYAPCSIDQLVAKGYQYWALGHVHQAEVIRKDPFIVFPGNLQGRHIREPGAKGACIVSVEDGEIVGHEWIHPDIVRWSRLDVPMQDCDRMGDALDLIRRSMASAIGEIAEGRILAFCVALSGATSLHNSLLVSGEQLIEQVRAIALEFGPETAWVERVLVETCPPESAEALLQRQDALGEVRQMLMDAADNPDLIEQLDQQIGEFVSKLPVDLRVDAEDPFLDAALKREYDQLIALGTDYMSARITAEEA